ncbi:MAG: ABC transporter ATP-binding protein [Chloroflexi bacterium]|nr:ABC transporter ATP-binding protein [Chloroflexota bacterium]
MIETHGLTKHFNGTVAVEGLDLHVNAGEIFAFLGPNGAGKTTTVRMLACLVAPTAGEAHVAGSTVGRDNDAIRAQIGILTESPGLYEKLSAQQNLDYFGRLYGLSNAMRADRVKYYLELLGLWERRDEPVGGFSKGMKQKLAIARALLHEPKIVFLDEPTSALDPEAAKIVRDFIAELKSEGRTIFLCTHNLDEADRLADHIGVMKQRLIQLDTPENLRRHLYGRHVVIRMRTVTDAHAAGVKALAFVKSLETRDGEMILGLDDPDEMTPAVVRALVQAGGEIQSVGEEKHSLEDVYLNLVGNGGGKQ